MINLRCTDHVKVSGNSMLPLIHDGDIVYYKPVDHNSIVVNDLLLVQTEEICFVHRVIYKQGNTLITKGDNSYHADKKIVLDTIIGKVYKIKRNGSTFALSDFYFVNSASYEREIKKFCSELEQNKFPYLILKGLPLHIFYEKVFPSRLFADCDFLISQRVYEEVKKSLTTNKFSEVETSFGLTEKLVDKEKSEVSYWKKIGSFPIVFDLHREPVFLMTQININNYLYSQVLLEEMTEEFFLSKRKIVIDNTSFYILSPHHLVMYLALHFFHHNYSGPFRLEFLHKIIKIEQLEDPYIWDKVEECIKKYDVQSFVYPVFLQLNIYYGTNVSSKTLQKIKPKNFFVRLICSLIAKQSIFYENSRVWNGIQRLILIYLLSPVSVKQKVNYLFFKKIIKTMFNLRFKFNAV